MGVNIILTEGGLPRRHPIWDSGREVGDRDLAEALEAFAGDRKYETTPADQFGSEEQADRWRPADIQVLQSHLQDRGMMTARAGNLISCLDSGNWFIRISY